MFLPLPALGAPCRNAGTGKAPETNVIWVKFESCEAAEPKPDFDITVIYADRTTESVTLSKPVGKKYWRGETARSFPISGRPLLRIDPATMRYARTAPNATSESFDAHPGCVFIYHIPCEMLWLLNVAKVPRDAQAALSYERETTEKTVHECNKTLPPLPKGPADITLCKSEILRVKVEFTPDHIVPVQIYYDLFGIGNRLSLSNVAPDAIATASSVESNKLMPSLRRKQLLTVLQDLEFTKNDLQ
ncbi:MAG TPA: hypothetical protein VMU84_00705 [Thermoanaerobaculia bacterium]|nr:hypothetical protein [Thermoanaerobaculia bacterium]